MKHELWRPIPGTAGRYEASSLGRVRSNDFFDGRRQVKGRVLRPATTASGHQQVMLGRGVNIHVHRCVAAAFIGPCPPLHEVLHLNHDPKDNKVENLKYGTRSENIKMDYAVGVRRLPISFGQNHGLAKLSEAAVRFIRQSDLSLAELGRMFDVCYQIIGSVKTRKTWGHVA